MSENRIVIDKRIMHGKPVVRGTRIPVEIIIGSLAGGMTFEEIEAEYGVGPEDIRACLRYAAQVLGEESVYPLEPSAELVHG